MTSGSEYKADGDWGIDLRNSLALINPLNQFLGFQLPESRHLRSSGIQTSEVAVLPVPSRAVHPTSTLISLQRYYNQIKNQHIYYDHHQHPVEHTSSSSFNISALATMSVSRQIVNKSTQLAFFWQTKVLNSCALLNQPIPYRHSEPWYRNLSN